MKVVLSFCAGIAVCSVLFFAVNLVMPVNAMESGSPAAVSANETKGLSGLLPDFEKIYRDALTMPFEKAESKITDPDIAEYYRALMDKTGLVPSKTTSK